MKCPQCKKEIGYWPEKDVNGKKIFPECPSRKRGKRR